MSEDNKVTESQEEEIDYKALYEKTQADLQAVAKKKDELLNETKKAKQARDDAEKERAQKDGEFEKLWQTEAQEKKALQDELNKFKQEIKTEKINTHAIKLAAELAKEDGGISAKLLAKFLTEDIAKIADENGNLEGSVLQAVKKQAESNKDFAPLLAGNKSSGGGAPGNMSSAHVDHKLTRAEFASLPPVKQSEFAAKCRRGDATLLD